MQDHYRAFQRSNASHGALLFSVHPVLLGLRKALCIGYLPQHGSPPHHVEQGGWHRHRWLCSHRRRCFPGGWRGALRCPIGACPTGACSTGPDGLPARELSLLFHFDQASVCTQLCAAVLSPAR